MKNDSMDVARLEILDQLFDGVYVTDLNRNIIYWNTAAEKITGFKSEEVLGKCCANNILMHVDYQGKQLCLDGCPLTATIESGQIQEAEVFLHHKDGHRIPVAVRATPYKDKNNNIIGAIEVFNDNTSDMKAKDRISELERLALWDELTQLPNRRYLQQQIETRFSELSRTGASFGLIAMDIDHFKIFNDTYGHDIGDKILQVVARTMSHARRPYDTVGRWGGEEFLMIATNVDLELLKSMGDRLRALVEQSRLTLDEQVLRVTISLGGVVAKKGDDPESLFKKADQMLYISKKEGRNRVTMALMVEGGSTCNVNSPTPH